MIDWLRRIIPPRSWLRLGYHQVMAIFAAMWWGLPGRRLQVVGVTGTTGKTSTVEILAHILAKSGKKVGSLSGIQFRVGEEITPNHSLRTTLSSWQTQKRLSQMVKQKCQVAIIEVSSHAIDQSRVWGIPFDTVLLTNLSAGEHLDYHPSMEHYVQTKEKLFRQLNTSARKPGVPKVMILNPDNEWAEQFREHSADQIWTFSRKGQASFGAYNIESTAEGVSFNLRMPNVDQRLSVPLLGEHSVNNLLAAIAGSVSLGVNSTKIFAACQDGLNIPGRLEKIEEGQAALTLVDFTYKPSALSAVLTSLQNLTEGRLIVVWGGAGGRSPENWQESAKIIHQYADEFVLTTDNPYDVPLHKIRETIREVVPRKEGENFFDIPDRYEAIRYGVYVATPDDIVLIAGRGTESYQTIGKQKYPFDDRSATREVLSSFLKTLAPNS